MPMSKVESIKELYRRRDERRRLGGRLIVPERPDRPKTRADCADGVRPCPWVGCKYHLFLEVRRNGSIAFPQGPELEALEAMPHSCVLDVAEQGGVEWDEVGAALNCSMQNTRLVEATALAKLNLDEELEDHRP